MNEKTLAPVMGDKDFEVMKKLLAKKHDIKLSEAQDFVRGAVKLKNRHRFLGNLMQRKGSSGYVEEMDWVLRHFFNVATRYAALESNFKPQAISLFERVFGAFDKDYTGNSLAQDTKKYIEDVNGNPTEQEQILNRMLNKWQPYRAIIASKYGERGALTIANGITRATAYLKLGFLNVSSATLNLTQLINAAGYLGGWKDLSKHVASLAARRGKLTPSELRILSESGVLNDIGLDTSTGYDRNRTSVFGDAGILDKLDYYGNKSMILFQKLDSLCRASTALAAFEKATKEGKSRAQALEYANKVNLNANFSYGVEDAPYMFRQSGPIGKVLFQFMKYPVKELEVLADMLPTNKKTSMAQKVAFWFPYFLACGLSGIIPGFDWEDEFLNKHFNLFPKDFLQKVIIQGTQSFFGEDSELGKNIAKVLMYGAPSLANVDVSKRTGMASIMPRDLESFLLGASGSTIWGTGKGAYNYLVNDDEGAFDSGLQSLSPGLYNIYAATKGETTTTRGRKNAVYDDLWSRAIRLMGFKSVDESITADIERIRKHERSKKTTERQRAIDAFLENETAENARRLKELGIKREDVIAERKRKQSNRRERFDQSLTKDEKKSGQYDYLSKFAQ